MQGLTAVQSQCLAAIQQRSAGGVAPSLEELRADLGFAHRSAVLRVLHTLKDRGAIRWRPRQARSIEIVADAFDPAALNRMQSEDLRRIMAHCAGILSRRDGGGAVADSCRRIADRLEYRPRASR